MGMNGKRIHSILSIPIRKNRSGAQTSREWKRGKERIELFQGIKRIQFESTRQWLAQGMNL